jgi:hypothetical protein
LLNFYSKASLEVENSGNYTKALFFKKINWQRSLWEGDQEVVKRSCTDEPMWVIIHLCMEATLGISLYSYLYPKLAKMLCLSDDRSLTFSVQQNWRREQKRFCLEASEVGRRRGRGERGLNNVYTYEKMYKQ